MTDIDKAIEEAKTEILPFESWERLAGESGAAFAAFCAFRDCGLERNVRRAVESVEKDEAVRAKRYRVWRNWAAQFRWRERAADYDRYMEKLKQGELRKTIEAQGEMHRRVTGKMLQAVEKKLDLMDASELTHGNVTEWVQTAIKAEREALQGLDANCLGLGNTSGKPEMKQGELNFVSDFNGL
jgi:hypothetical protein